MVDAKSRNNICIDGHLKNDNHSQLTLKNGPEPFLPIIILHYIQLRARCSSVVRVFAHGAMGLRIDPSWGGPIVLFLVPASAQ